MDVESRCSNLVHHLKRSNQLYGQTSSLIYDLPDRSHLSQFINLIELTIDIRPILDLSHLLKLKDLTVYSNGKHKVVTNHLRFPPNMQKLTLKDIEGLHNNSFYSLNLTELVGDDLSYITAVQNKAFLPTTLTKLILPSIINPDTLFPNYELDSCYPSLTWLDLEAAVFRKEKLTLPPNMVRLNLLKSGIEFDIPQKVEWLALTKLDREVPCSVRHLESLNSSVNKLHDGLLVAKISSSEEMAFPEGIKRIKFSGAKIRVVPSSVIDLDLSVDYWYAPQSIPTGLIRLNLDIKVGSVVNGYVLKYLPQTITDLRMTGVHAMVDQPFPSLLRLVLPDAKQLGTIPPSVTHLELPAAIQGGISGLPIKLAHLDLRSMTLSDLDVSFLNMTMKYLDLSSSAVTRLDLLKGELEFISIRTGDSFWYMSALLSTKKIRLYNLDGSTLFCKG